MADERLTDRTTLSELADGDLIHVVDISDTTDNPLGTSKKGLWSLFKSTLLTYFNTQYLRSVTGDSVDNTDPLNPVVNAIPLSGTEVGSPVTGDIEFNILGKIFQGLTTFQTEGDSFNSLGLRAIIGGVEKFMGINEFAEVQFTSYEDFENYSSLTFRSNGLNIFSQLPAGQLNFDVSILDTGPNAGSTIMLLSNEFAFHTSPLEKGISALTYFGANYDDNTYVQKKYVDDKYNVSGTTNYISKFTASDSIGNSQIYDNGTNLGVGNTSPSYKLDVSGTGRFTGNLFIEGVDTPAITITDTTNNLAGRIRVANTFMYIDADNSDTVGSTRILLRTDGVEALRLDENQNATFGGIIAVQGTGDSSFAGNVGINTTSPTAKLHVVGLPTYADNATALAGGLTVGAFYHTAGVLKVVI